MFETMGIEARRQFTAAAAGVFLCFAVFGLFAGLAGMFLAGPASSSRPRPPAGPRIA